jgi:hypothetical protein
MEKFLKGGGGDKEKSGGKGQKEWSIKLSRNWGIVVGVGTLIALYGIFSLFGKKNETKVEIKSGLSPTQLETQLKEHLEPIYEGQKETVEALSKVSQNLKEISQSLKELSKELKEVKGAKTSEEKKQMETINRENTAWEQKSQIPKEVINAGNISPYSEKAGGENIQKNFELINPVKHISTVKVVEGKYGEQKVIYPQGYNPKVKGREEGGQKKEKKKVVYIPAGSIAEAELLYGFVAPEEGKFPPVLLILKRSVWTPNDWYIPLQRCAIVTKAQYDISAGLAILGGKGSILSCVLPNGKVVQKSVNVAVGEEISKNGRYLAIMGLRGKEVWLTPKDLAIIGSMKFGEGLSNAFQQGLVEQSMTSAGTTITAIKQRGMYALLGGVKESMNAYSQFWLKKYAKKVPAIEVTPPKRVFVEFIEGVNLDVDEKELEE